MSLYFGLRSMIITLPFLRVSRKCSVYHPILALDTV